MAAIVLFAAGLRFAYPGRMAVEHFDEGVYASNIFFTAEEGGQYPYRHLYAPPLLPFLIEWGIIFLGPESIAPFLPALILGTATVPLAWWAARCWSGPASGLAAGLLVATSDFHLLYSRTALTDVPVAFFLLLAVYLYWEAVRRGSLRWAVAAGVATGLAWWTKYTGWLPLAIAASGSSAWVLFERRDGVGFSVRAKLVAKLFAVMAVTAFVVWSPVLWGLQKYGGYGVVAENHRGYLRPLAQWGFNAWEQGGNLAAQSGGLTAVSLSAVLAVASLGWRKPPWFVVPAAAWCALMTGWAALEMGPAVILAVVVGMGLAVDHFSASRMRTTFSQPVGGDDPGTRLATWLITAWFVGMSVSTPFYHPYPRLVMPWLLAALLGATVWMTQCPWTAGARAALPLALLLLPAAVFVERSLPNSWGTTGWNMPAWQDRSGLRDAASEIAETFRRERPPHEPAVVYVYTGHSDPAVFFHLAAMLGPEGAVVLPAGDFSFISRHRSAATPFAVTSLVAINARPLEEARTVAGHLWTVGGDDGQAGWEPSGTTYLDRGTPYSRGLASGHRPNSMWPHLYLVRVK